MPRKCVGTLQVNHAAFPETTSNPSAGDRCSFCKPREELESLSRTSWSAIARVAATLTSDQQALFLNRLSHVPNLKSIVETTMLKKCGQIPVAESEEKTGTHESHDSAPCHQIADVSSKHQRMSVLDQGNFGLCSEFALATCAAHSLQCKHGLFRSDETLLDKWHNNAMPPKAMWPDECANFIGEFRHKWPILPSIQSRSFCILLGTGSISVKWFLHLPVFAVRW